MLLCAITDRRFLGADEDSRGNALVELARGWAAGDVDFVQIREKDLGPVALLALARRVVTAGEERFGGANRTAVLLNGPAEMALEAGCDGVHLPAGLGAEAIAPVHEAFARAGRRAVVSVACHATGEVRAAAAGGASLILFAPVFEKRLAGQEAMAGRGLAALAEACEAAGGVPVLALGGVTAENAAACVRAGAAGVAAIRLFAGEDWRELGPNSTSQKRDAGHLFR